MDAPRAGLTYRKFDLHVHTPVSPCFGDKSVTAKDIVQRALAVGLDGVAITDHNSGTMVDDVKAAAHGTALTIFPGVEIHASGGRRGIHVIALLDPSKGTADVEDLLSKVGLSPHQFGDPDAVAKPIEEVVATIESVGGVAVCAHANSTKGATADMQGRQRTKLFELQALRAVEVTPSDFAKPAGQRVTDFLSGTDPNYGFRHMAVYVASDNQELDAQGQPTGRHCCEGIGSSYCYFKTEENPTLESLRQCFIDPEVRIRLPRDIASATPEDIEDYPRIVDVSVNDGFLRNQLFEFHPGLNTVVGPKGSGKSMLVEVMRFALDSHSLVEHIQRDHNSKLEKRLGLHGGVTLRLCDRTGSVQEIQREFNPQSDHPFSSPTMYDVAHDFPILFLSQGEMVRIAEDREQQMAFLDRFFDFRSFVERIAVIEADLAVLDKQLGDAIRNQQATSATKRRVEALTKRIQQLDKTLKDPAFRAYYHQKMRLDLADRLGKSIEEHRDALTLLVSETQPFVPPKVPESLEKDPGLRRLADIASQSRTKAIGSLKKAAAAANEDLKRAQDEQATILADHEVAKKAYLTRARELGGNQQTLSAERETKQTELERETRKLDVLNQSPGAIQTAAKARNAKLSELEAVYAEYTAARRELCDRITSESSDRVRVTVEEQGNRAIFGARLASLKVGSYVSGADVDAIVAAVTPRELVSAVLNYELNRKDSALETVAKKSSLEIDVVRKLAEHMLGSHEYEDILAFQYSVTPSDSPLIEVEVGGGRYAPIDEVSTGQKCTGLIVIALSATDGPVVIDQPEDSLDITGIWDDMCRTLRRGKDYQQFILTSHSSNLAVASDTDCYSVLAASASEAHLVRAGALDGSDVREDVLKVLEGGKKAYGLKSRKYGIELADGR